MTLAIMAAMEMLVRLTINVYGLSLKVAIIAYVVL